ncbi:MAG: V-type ATP synthase subunit K [Candidatus Eremiobacteraeota bacterium]|nr:V-type ATP synthase subunit K [Candidatus Eremiobacteraeota bacterium]
MKKIVVVALILICVLSLFSLGWCQEETPTPAPTNVEDKATAEAEGKSSGFIWALFGAAMAAFLGGVGSSIGTGIAGMAASGLISREPEKFVPTLILQALPGTQGIYGFLGALLVARQLGWLGGGVITPISAYTGWLFFAACLPVGITGLLSGIYQGKVAAAGINIVAKAGTSHVVKGIVYAVVVETYAILGLIATILLLNGIKI